MCPLFGGSTKLTYPTYIILLVAGLEFWEVLFHRGGRTGFVTIENDNDDTIGDADDHGSGQNRMKMVLFLVLNCLLSVSLCIGYKDVT